MRLSRYARSAQLRGAWYSFVGEDADRERDRDVLGVEEVRLVLPVQASGGDPGVGQPVERDVVEEVVAREVALQPSLEDLLHQAGLPGPVAVVERERREIDGRVRQSVQRLRTRRHDLRVGHVLRIEGAQLLVRAQLLLGETDGAGSPGSTPLTMSVEAVPGMLEWMPSRPAGAWMPMACVTACAPPVAPLRHELGVAERLHQHRVGAGPGRIGSQPVAAGFAENP